MMELGKTNGRVDNAPNPHKPAFNAAVDSTLGRALMVSNERGGEYGDTWALENQQTRFLDMVLNEIDSTAFSTKTLSREEKRLIMVACLCDVKVSRMLGGFKGDTLDDLINYSAALRGWLADYVDGKPQA